MIITRRSLPIRKEKQFEDMQADTANLQSAQSDTDAMVVEQEYNLTLLQLGITDDTEI
nr:MAG TPA: hypothetical protein [Caudoviricetes sp.]